MIHYEIAQGNREMGVYMQINIESFWPDTKIWSRLSTLARTLLYQVAKILSQINNRLCKMQLAPSPFPCVLVCCCIQLIELLGCR